jgi:hypothetical protein
MSFPSDDSNLSTNPRQHDRPDVAREFQEFRNIWEREAAQYRRENPSLPTNRHRDILPRLQPFVASGLFQEGAEVIDYIRGQHRTLEYIDTKYSETCRVSVHLSQWSEAAFETAVDRLFKEAARIRLGPDLETREDSP